MKRVHKEEYEHGVFKYRSIFKWKNCACCKQDFRRENGFKYEAGPVYNGLGRWYYLCGTCIPSREEANEYAILGKQNILSLPPRADDA